MMAMGAALVMGSLIVMYQRMGGDEKPAAVRPAPKIDPKAKETKPALLISAKSKKEDKTPSLEPAESENLD